MIREKVVQALTTGVVVAVCTGVSLIAAAFGIFVLLRGIWGETVASAVIAALFAVMALMVAYLASRKAAPAPRPVKPAPELPPLMDTVMEMVREKPLVSAAVAAIAGIIVIQNPQIISTLAKVFLDDPDSDA